MMSQGSSATDAVECVDTITEVDIILRMGVHDGVDGANDGFSATGLYAELKMLEEELKVWKERFLRNSFGRWMQEL